MESNRILAEEREQRYREAKRAKQEKEQEKQRALLRFQEDRAEQRRRHSRPVLPTPVSPSPAAERSSPAGLAAEARLGNRSTEETPQEGGVGLAAAEEGGRSLFKPKLEETGPRESKLRVRHVDGRIFEGVFSGATTLKCLRAFVIASHSDRSSQVDRLLNAEQSQQDTAARGGPADQVRFREGGPQSRGRTFRGGGRVAFHGAPKTLSQSAEAEEEREVIEEAGRAFQQQTAMVIEEALRLRAGGTGEELKESDVFFLIPFPRAEFFEEEKLDITLEEAGLCPQGTLVVHIQGQQREAPGGGGVREARAEPAGRAQDQVGHEQKGDPLETEEQEHTKRRIRELALEAAAKRVQAAGQENESKVLVDGTAYGAPEVGSQGVEQGAVDLMEPVDSSHQEEGRQGAMAELAGMEGAEASAQEVEREERRKRMTEAVAQRMGEGVGQQGAAKAQNIPSQGLVEPKPHSVSLKGKEKDEETVGMRAGRSAEVERRLAAVRAEQAAKAAEKERINRMLKEDREKRKDRLAWQQAVPSSDSSPPSAPLPRVGGAGDPSLNAAAAAVERAAVAKLPEQQGPMSVPSSSAVPATPASPAAPVAVEPGISRLRIRLEDGSVRMAMFPVQASMHMVLESVLPPGADAAAFGLRVLFPETDFFDDDALCMTIEQAGLAPHATVHLLPRASRGMVRQGTAAPWRGRGSAGSRAQSQEYDERSDEDEANQNGSDVAGAGLYQAFGAAEDMTYEQMLQLQARVGSVHQCVPDETISMLPTRIIQSNRDTEAPLVSNEGAEKCAVCLCEFQHGDEVTTLPCVHMYHSDCIGKWLRQSKACPTCKQNVC